MSRRNKVSRKEAERLLEEVRDIRKEKGNSTCFTCGDKRPTCIIFDFNTFVCMACSGLHRDFQFRQGSISMVTFTQEQVM